MKKLNFICLFILLSTNICLGMLERTSGLMPIKTSGLLNINLFRNLSNALVPIETIEENTPQSIDNLPRLTPVLPQIAPLADIFLDKITKNLPNELGKMQQLVLVELESTDIFFKLQKLKEEFSNDKIRTIFINALLKRLEKISSTNISKKENLFMFPAILPSMLESLNLEEDHQCIEQVKEKLAQYTRLVFEFMVKQQTLRYDHDKSDFIIILLESTCHNAMLELLDY